MKWLFYLCGVMSIVYGIDVDNTMISDHFIIVSLLFVVLARQEKAGE